MPNNTKHPSIQEQDSAQIAALDNLNFTEADRIEREIQRLPHIITHTVDVETETHESMWPLADVSEIGRKNMVNEEKNTQTNLDEKSAEADAESELLPCPFCGGSAVRGIFNVWCDNCKVATREDVDATLEQIIASWNTRHLFLKGAK